MVRGYRHDLSGGLGSLCLSALLWVVALPAIAADRGNLHALASDLTVPPLSDGVAGAGRRIQQSNPGYEGWDLFHVLYLPTDWTPGTGRARYPVIVEYPGNGGYQNALGDTCSGMPADCHLGYGLTGGRGFIWVALPFVDRERRRHARNWWGDADATAAYCVQTVRRVCDEYGGDPAAVVLTGFSRGAIACNYIGLRNDEIAKLWCAMMPHSHYDGVRQWPHADSDTVSAAARLRRLGSRPQFISHESSVSATRDFLRQHAPDGNFTFLALPYPNHTDEWVLKDIPERAEARSWLWMAIRRGPPLP
jgi:hypothetical protein